MNDRYGYDIASMPFRMGMNFIGLIDLYGLLIFWILKPVVACTSRVPSPGIPRKTGMVKVIVIVDSECKGCPGYMPIREHVIES